MEEPPIVKFLAYLGSLFRLQLLKKKVITIFMIIFFKKCNLYRFYIDSGKKKLICEHPDINTRTHTHVRAHTHTHILIYIYIYIKINTNKKRLHKMSFM